MSKQALLQREIKRDKLVAKFAKKHAELKKTSNDFKRTDDERALARLELQKLPTTPTLLASVIVARSRVVRVARSANLVWLAPRFVSWHLRVISLVSPKQAGKHRRTAK